MLHAAKYNFRDRKSKCFGDRQLKQTDDDHDDNDDDDNNDGDDAAAYYLSNYITLLAS